MIPFVSLQNVGLSYHTLKGEVPALYHINFSIQEGEFVSLIGPSGCGKSTILNLIAGLLTPETGSISIRGTPVSESSVYLGYMLQRDHLFEWRTVYENVILGLEIQKKCTPDNLDFVDHLLSNYGLAEFRDSKPSQLSGGMRQRAALIRTLALQPSLLLLDEPFSALDYQTRLQVSDDIWTILRKEHKTALLVTHDIAEAVSMSDRVLVLSKPPATVQKEIPIQIKTEPHNPMNVRNATEFKDYFNLIWKELHHNEF